METFRPPSDHRPPPSEPPRQSGPRATATDPTHPPIDTSGNPTTDDGPAGAPAHPSAPADPHEQFTALMARHHSGLMGFILSLVHNWTDAEDLLQQTSVVLWRRFGEFRPATGPDGAGFMAWACQVARYHVLNFRRRQTRDRHVFSDETLEALAGEGADDAGALDSERRALDACLAKLDAGSRDLLRRCYEPGALVTRIAEELGRTANSIYKGLNRIREGLLRCIRRTLAGEAA